MLEVHYHFKILLTLFVILLCAFVWFYKKSIAPYKDLPWVPIPFIFKLIVIDKIPKNFTATSYIFQRIIEFCQKFQSDGLCLFWIIHPYLFIFGEEAIKVFSNEEAALNKSHNYEILHESFGFGLVSSNGALWRKRRKLFNPVFNTSFLKSKFSVINANAAILVKQLMKTQNKSVNVLEDIKFCAFSNICESILGLDVKERKTEVENCIKLINESTALIVYRFIHPWLHPNYTIRFFSEGRKYLKNLEEFREFATKLLLEMKEATLSHRTKIQSNNTNLQLEDTISKQNTKGEFHEIIRKSFAQVLVEHHLQDPSFNFECMLDELRTFVLAGYDTVSYAIMWCLFMLGHHQEVQEQVYNELEFLDGSDLFFDDLQKLTYMDCAVKETLRLYPPVPVYARKLENNVQCGKYDIPKGTNIIFFPYMYHRDAKIYPDPEKFDPERFSEGNARKEAGTYISFSEGKRNCIGKKFALMEIKIILAHILRNFKVTSLDRREDITLEWEIVLSSVKPLNMRCTPRQQNEVRG